MPRNKFAIGNTIRRGMKMTDEQRKNISDGHKGLKKSEETKKKIRDILRNKKRPHVSGHLNYNWKGGINPVNDTIRKSIEFRLWRESVFSRDNWTCCKCFSKGVDLNAHHIKNFASCVELRFAIDNGITFCKHCHFLFHVKYGKKDNDLNQVREFLI